QSAGAARRACRARVCRDICRAARPDAARAYAPFLYYKLRPAVPKVGPSSSFLRNLNARVSVLQKKSAASRFSMEQHTSAHPRPFALRDLFFPATVLVALFLAFLYLR